MTRDEAIAHGKEQLEIFGGTHREFILMAIKALERPHGEWIPHPLEKGIMSIDRDVCSICGVQFTDAWMFDYCPICGSYMRGDEDERKFMGMDGRM